VTDRSPSAMSLPAATNGSCRFVPAEDRIHVEAYSLLLDKHDKRPKHTCTLDYDMIAAAPTGTESSSGIPVVNESSPASAG